MSVTKIEMAPQQQATLHALTRLSSVHESREHVMELHCTSRHINTPIHVLEYERRGEVLNVQVHYILQKIHE